MSVTTPQLDKAENLRIDYSKYEVDELVETISDALLFPLYIGMVVGRVLLLAIGILVVLAVYGTYHWLTAILFFIPALAITMPSVLLFSVIRLFSTIKSDLAKVYEITIDTALHAYNDAHKLKSQRKNKMPVKQSFADVFKGVSLYVIRPTLKRVLSRRIKWFSRPFTWLIDIIFKKIFIKNAARLNLTQADGDGTYTITDAKTGKQNTNGLGAKIVNTTFATFKFPFRLALVLYGLVNMLIIRLLLYIL